jgi:GNAT superfamily N-acetyltransferase
VTFGSTEPFDGERRDASGFDCSEPALDAWLRSYAGQSQRRDAARTFVAADSAGRIAGYYTLVAAVIDHSEATTATRRGLSRHFPIPAALLARLAVDREHQGSGLGRSLLLDALERILRASDEVAMRAVLVHAKSPAAASFYARYGFEPSGIDALTLMVPLPIVRATLGDG